MMKTSVLIFKNLLLILLISNINSLMAQGKINHDTNLKKTIEALFATYNRLDSISIQFENNKAQHLYLYRKPTSENVPKYNYDHIGYFSLEFEGDLYLLKKQYPMILEFLNDKKLLLKNGLPDKSVSVRLTIESNNSFLRKPIYASSVFARVNKTRMIEFMKLLHDNYNDSIIPPKDSTLIFQAVVDKAGNLGQTEVLQGNKNNFYDYLLNNYKNYTKNLLPKTSSYIGENLISPYLTAGRPLNSIIDIYVRLNSDKTFTVTGNGRERKLKLKNFTEDPNSPLALY